jgi:hypothetical protein
MPRIVRPYDVDDRDCAPTTPATGGSLWLFWLFWFLNRLSREAGEQPKGDHQTVRLNMTLT